MRWSVMVPGISPWLSIDNGSYSERWNSEANRQTSNQTSKPEQPALAEQKSVHGENNGMCCQNVISQPAASVLSGTTASYHLQHLVSGRRCCLSAAVLGCLYDFWKYVLVQVLADLLQHFLGDLAKASQPVLKNTDALTRSVE